MALGSLAGVELYGIAAPCTASLVAGAVSPFVRAPSSRRACRLGTNYHRSLAVGRLSEGRRERGNSGVPGASSQSDPGPQVQGKVPGSCRLEAESVRQTREGVPEQLGELGCDGRWTQYALRDASGKPE